MYFRFSPNIFKNDISTFFRTNKIENNQKVNYRGYCPIIFFLRLQKILQIMKSILLKTLVFLILVACNKDDDKIKSAPVFTLPPETQTGANTFGVTIRGKVYVPRDPIGVNYGGTVAKGMIWWGGGIIPYQYNELEVKDGASSVGFNLIIHLQKPGTVANYSLSSSNFQEQASSVLENHIFFKIWDFNISNYAYYGSIENQSFLNITRRDNGIISGNFTGLFSRQNNVEDKIQITDGRFDINTNTLSTKLFP